MRFRCVAMSMALQTGLLACSSPEDGGAMGRPAGAAVAGEAAATLAADSPGRDGVLRYGYDLTNSAGISLDPRLSNTVGDVVHMSPIYDTLLRPAPDGGYRAGLAIEWGMVDASTLDLSLRPGVRFHDGTALNAEAVKFSIERNIEARNLNHAPQLRAVERVELRGPLALRIHLSTPTAGAFYELLAGRETMPVSPTAVRAGVDFDRNPVGAGPYRVVEILPERILELRRFEDHWEADTRRLAGIDFVHAPSGPSRVNALFSGDIDLSDFTAGDHRALTQRAGVKLAQRPSRSSFLYFTMCKSVPPFDDVRVRRAIGHAIDRESFNRVVLDGLGEIGWMAWPGVSAYFDPTLVALQQPDLDRARELLAEAKLPDGFGFEILVPTGGPGPLQMAEVLQAQLQRVGIEVRIRSSSNIIKDMIDRRAPTTALFWVRPGLQKVTRMFGPDSVANFCSYRDAQLDALTDRIAALPPDDAPEVVELWHELQGIIARDALVHYLAYQPVILAWREDRVSGVGEILDTGQGIDFAPLRVVR